MPSGNKIMNHTFIS